jgi:chromosome segregation ATPase
MMNQANSALLTLQQIEQKLGQRFSLEQTTALVEVFDSFRQMEVRHAQDTAELKQTTAKFNTDTAELKEAVASLTKAVERLVEAQTRTEERLDEVEGRLGKVEGRLDKVEGRLDKLEAAVARLIEVQIRMEERLGKVEERLGKVEERLGKVEERLDKLEAAVARLIEVQIRMEERLGKVEERLGKVEERLDKLEARFDKLEARFDKLEARFDKAEQRMDKIIGLQLEQDYARKAPAYFGRVLRRVKVVSIQEIEEDLAKHLSDDEIGELMLLDLLVRGQPRQQPDAPEVWLAVEVSARVDQKDAVRAQERAALLQKAGYRVIPTLAGERITQGAAEFAAEHRLFLLQNGQSQFWGEALQTGLVV